STSRRVRMARSDDLEFREWWSRYEALIWIDVGSGHVINSHQACLVKIVDLFHGFSEGKTQMSIARLHARAIHLNVLIRIWQVVRLSGRKLDLVLIYAGGPKQAHNIRPSLLSKSRDNLRWPLRKVSAAAGDLPFLL